MKNLKIVCFFGLVIFCCCMVNKNRLLFSNQYFEINANRDLYHNWDFEMRGQENIIVKRSGVEIGKIVVYPQCDYTSSVASIIANIYGMHAFLIEEYELSSDIPNLKYCFVVDYEPTAAGKIVGIKELHYIYLSNDFMVDFCMEYDALDENALVLMRSVCILQ